MWLCSCPYGRVCIFRRERWEIDKEWRMVPSPAESQTWNETSLFLSFLFTVASWQGHLGGRAGLHRNLTVYQPHTGTTLVSPEPPLVQLRRCHFWWRHTFSWDQGLRSYKGLLNSRKTDCCSEHSWVSWQKETHHLKEKFAHDIMTEHLRDIEVLQLHGGQRKTYQFLSCDVGRVKEKAQHSWILKWI